MEAMAPISVAPAKKNEQECHDAKDTRWDNGHTPVIQEIDAVGHKV